MARRKDTIVLFKPYESRSPNGNEKGYVRITPSLFHSDAVRDINYASFKIYLDMRFVASGNTMVIYTQELAHKNLGVCKGTYVNAIKELKNVGLIKALPRACYSPARYEFISDWQKYSSRKRDCLSDDFPV